MWSGTIGRKYSWDLPESKWVCRVQITQQVQHTLHPIHTTDLENYPLLKPCQLVMLKG